MKKLAHKDVVPLVAAMARRICDWQPLTPILEPKCFPVPRGGIPVAYMLLSHFPNLQIVDDRELADFFVDDLVDSGETRDRYMERHPGKGFFALLDKGVGLNKDMNWYMFPWEIRDGGGDASGTDNITRLLQFIGEDPKREGLKETPDRVAKAWRHWCSGYGKDPAAILKVFEDGAEGCDQMVVRKDIPLYSHCEHHMAAIIGSCTVAYIPQGKVVGLSKLDRLVDIFARRLQVQERLTNQIADALQEHLNPVGVGVWINARHLCVESRGVQHRNSDTITTALRGAIRDEPAARAEFLALARTR